MGCSDSTLGIEQAAGSARTRLHHVTQRRLRYATVGHRTGAAAEVHIAPDRARSASRSGSAPPHREDAMPCAVPAVRAFTPRCVAERAERSGAGTMPGLCPLPHTSRSPWGCCSRRGDGAVQRLAPGQTFCRGSLVRTPLSRESRRVRAAPATINPGSGNRSSNVQGTQRRPRG